MGLAWYLLTSLKQLNSQSRFVVRLAWNVNERVSSRVDTVRNENESVS